MSFSMEQHCYDIEPFLEESGHTLQTPPVSAPAKNPRAEATTEVAWDEDDDTQLIECEKAITDYGVALREGCKAFATIRGKRLYRRDHATFTLYCKARWGLSTRGADQLNLAVDHALNLTESESRWAQEPADFDSEERCHERLGQVAESIGIRMPAAETARGVRGNAAVVVRTDQDPSFAGTDVISVTPEQVVGFAAKLSKKVKGKLRSALLNQSSSDGVEQMSEVLKDIGSLTAEFARTVANG